MYSMGGEAWINSMVALRLGYKLNYDVNPTVTAGFGLKLRGFRFDYAVVSLNNTLGGFAQRVSLLTNF